MSLVVAAMLLASAVALVAMSQPASATFPGQNGKIAFVKDRNIYTIDPAGGEATKLTNLPASLFPSTLAYSPDGEKIAFSADTGRGDWEVWVVDADGANPVQLTNSRRAYISNEAPAWFPGGRRIAFSSNRGGRGADIYVLTLNEARNRVVGVKQLTTRRGGDFTPAVSPNGKKMAFVSSRGRGFRNIFVMRANAPEGSRNVPAPLTRDLTGTTGGAFWPNWSPDGKRIVFTTFSDDGSLEERLYSMRPDGSDKNELTDLTNTGGGAHPVYSPDGTQIAFCNAGAIEGIWRIDSDGSDLTSLTATDCFEADPSWQPLPNGTSSTSK